MAKAVLQNRIMGSNAKHIIIILYERNLSLRIFGFAAFAMALAFTCVISFRIS